MNTKIKELRINSAKNKVLETYSYLNIRAIYSSLDEEYMKFYEHFRSLNFNKKEFPFHDNGTINSFKIEQEHGRAVNLFCNKIINLEIDTSVYITIGFSGIGFWVEIEIDKLRNNMEKFIEEYGANFFFYAYKDYGIEIYKAEYAWEVLYTF